MWRLVKTPYALTPQDKKTSVWVNQALYTNSTGVNNVAMGRRALYLNVASNNTALGHQSLYNNSSGANNTAVGLSALSANTTSSQNTAVGYPSADFANNG